jgi:hypothetical protein
MPPSFTRRQYLFGAGGAVVSGAFFTEKVKKILEQRYQDKPYKIQSDANFLTAEPVITDTDVSTDSASPNWYATLVRTQEEADKRYRVKYLKEEYDIDISGLYTIDYETEFLAIIGYVLPKNRLLRLTEDEYKDETLYTTHEITDSRTDLDDIKVHHNVIIYHQQGHEPPEDIDANFCIK